MAEQNSSNPYLYILMRRDLDSMNTGKAVAQGAHAANQMVYCLNASGTDDQKKLLKEWEGATQQGFGPTITLGSYDDDAPLDEITLTNVVEFAQKAGFIAGVTHDPRYPLKDGKVCHLIPLNTCGYVFGDKDALKPLLGQFGLHP
jgi:hypothetical protein